jgi:hypothetical protein
MSRLRRAAWMKWLPPMEKMSPSPAASTTVRSGRAIFRPEAKASERPWVVCTVLKSRWPGMREVQPMPETMATLFFSVSSPAGSM